VLIVNSERLNFVSQDRDSSCSSSAVEAMRGNREFFKLGD